MKIKILFLVLLFVASGCFNTKVLNIGENDELLTPNNNDVGQDKDYFDIILGDDIDNFNGTLVKIKGTIQDNRENNIIDNDVNNISFGYLNEQGIFEEEVLQGVTGEEKNFLLEFELGEEKETGEHYFDLRYQSTLHRVYMVGPEFDIKIFNPDSIEGLSSLNFLSLNDFGSHLGSEMTLVINDAL